MPAENEIKYVLDFGLTEDILEDHGWRFKAIPRQGYIPANASIEMKDGIPTFRYQLHIPENGRDIVLEKQISQDDYDDLWKKSDNGALPKDARVREYGDKFMFTYKQWCNAKNRDTEIEMKISEDDFEVLYAQRLRDLSKNRYYAPDNHTSDHDWSVDYILDDADSAYLVLAEVEMPDGMEDPDYIPDLIKPYIAYRVPKGDKNFSNSALCDQNHARAMLEQIGVLPSSLPSQEL